VIAPQKSVLRLGVSLNVLEALYFLKWPFWGLVLQAADTAAKAPAERPL
jgi:hypothetical protein